jgi:ABC-type bacteriocin/lantibiotic exporter with double-glycine peptidase domain
MCVPHNFFSFQLIGQQGNLCVAGTLSLCPQQPAILNTTVRENILFGQPMNSQRYYRAICCAQLTKDLEQLPENERSKVSLID